MAPTTLRLPNAISERHLKIVMAKMRELGAPTIPVVDCGDCYVALDGSHRSIAAAKLRLRVVLDILSPSEVVSADDLGTDFFSGRQKARWIARGAGAGRPCARADGGYEEVLRAKSTPAGLACARADGRARCGSTQRPRPPGVEHGPKPPSGGLQN